MVAQIGIGEVAPALAAKRGVDHREIERVVGEAIELGVALIEVDGADRDALRLVGGAVKALRARDRSAVITRVAPGRGDLGREVEEQLRASGLEVLPRVMLELRAGDAQRRREWPDLVGRCGELVREGKVLAWGAWLGDRDARAVDLGDVDRDDPKYADAVDLADVLALLGDPFSAVSVPFAVCDRGAAPLIAALAARRAKAAEAADAARRAKAAEAADAANRPGVGHQGPGLGQAGPPVGHPGPVPGLSGPPAGHHGPALGLSGPLAGQPGPPIGHSGLLVAAPSPLVLDPTAAAALVSPEMFAVLGSAGAMAMLGIGGGAAGTAADPARPVDVYARRVFAGGALAGGLGPDTKLAPRDDRRGALDTEAIAVGIARLASLVETDPPAVRSCAAALGARERAGRRAGYDLECATVAELALRYVLGTAGVTAALPRVHATAHVRDLLAWAARPGLSEQTRRFLDEW